MEVDTGRRLPINTGHPLDRRLNKTSKRWWKPCPAWITTVANTMRLPIKLNENWLPKIARRLIRCQHDPRVLINETLDSSTFSKAVSVLKFGNTFKTTCAARFPQTLKALSELRFDVTPVVLDIGASDGSTSADIMQNVDYKHYFVTDLNLFVCYSVVGKWTYFYDIDGTPLLAASNHWIVYNETSGALYPLNVISKKIFERAPQHFSHTHRIELISPSVRGRLDSSISIHCHNALNPWPLEKADLIVASNILNRVYFNEDQLRTILRNIKGALQDKGVVALIDNRSIEQSTILTISKQAVSIESRVGPGSDVESLAVSVFSESD